MDQEPTGHLLSMPIVDVYGRKMGEIVGVIYNLQGKIESLGVSESAGKFAIYPGCRLQRHDSTVVVIPEWRAEAADLARQRESLARRETAIEELSRCHDIDPRLFEEVRMQLDAARASHERLKTKVEARLTELEAKYQSVSDFMGISKVQHATSEIDEWSFAVTSEFARVELETDGRELADLRSAMGFLEDIEECDPLPQPATSIPALFDLLSETSSTALIPVPAL